MVSFLSTLLSGVFLVFDENTINCLNRQLGPLYPVPKDGPDRVHMYALVRETIDSCEKKIYLSVRNEQFFNTHQALQWKWR